ncbi:MAG: hypothetical protein ACR5KV_01065 [Wolbachia sp.]
MPHTQKELKSVKENLEQSQNILQQKEDQKETLIQTEVKYKSKGTSMQQQDQDTHKGMGIDASSSTDQEETKEMEVQTDLQMKDSYDLYNIKNKHVKTTFKDVSIAPAKVSEKSTPSNDELFLLFSTIAMLLQSLMSGNMLLPK